MAIKKDKPTPLATQKPEWFDTRFDRLSEYATFRIPDSGATVFEEAVINLLTATALWPQLMELRTILAHQAAEPNTWTHVGGVAPRTSPQAYE